LTPFTTKEGILKDERFKQIYGVEVEVLNEEVNNYGSGNEELDKVIGEIIRGINTFIGGFATGKSTLCKMYVMRAINIGDHVIYIDTENKVTKHRFKQMIEYYNIDEDKFSEKFHLIRVRRLDELIEKIEEIFTKEEWKEKRTNCLLIIDGFSTPYMEEFRTVSDKFELASTKNSFFFYLETYLTMNNTVCVVTIKLKSELTIIDELKKRDEIKGNKEILQDLMLFKHGQDMGYDSGMMLMFRKLKKKRFFTIEKHPYKKEYCDSEEKHYFKINDGGLELKDV